MPFAERLGRTGLIVLSCCIAIGYGGLTAARADQPPAVDADAALVVLSPFGSGFANLRAAPDPRSEAVLKVATGATGLRATGRVTRYGDTWWIEVHQAAVTGWLNARLAGIAPAGVALQPFINIDALQPVDGVAFKAIPYRQAAATAFEECARRCVTDEKCLAISFNHTPPVCSQFDQRPDVGRQGHVDSAMKPAPIPGGGWMANAAGTFERSVDHALDGEAKHERLAHSADECAAACAADQLCAAYVYERKALMCALHETTAKMVARAGVETGTRRRPIPVVATEAPVATQRASPAPVTALAQPPQQFPAKAAVPAAPPSMESAIAPPQPLPEPASVDALFRDLMVDVVLEAGIATSEISARGRVTIKLRKASLGESEPAIALGVAALTLEGDVNNLAPLLDPARPDVLEFVYYAEPMARPVVLGSSTFDTETAAVAAALKMQKQLDAIAHRAGLGIDQMALLKPMRR